MFKGIAIAFVAVALAAVTTSGVSNSLVTEMYVPGQPATFELSALNISPSEAGPGEVVTISMHVQNVGAVRGEHEVALVINDEAVQVKKVVMNGGAGWRTKFLVSYDTVGTYNVTVGELTGAFTIKAPGADPWVWIVIAGIVMAAAIVALMITKSLRAVPKAERVPLKQSLRDGWSRFSEQLKSKFRRSKSETE